MSWLSSTSLLGVVLAYLVFLFVVASVAEAFAPHLNRGRIRTLTYVIAASVYCTAWTFYGSVGLAANRGLEFLTIYLGPVCVAILWPVLLRKLVRVSKEQRITSISDFISSRYGKSAQLGTLATPRRGWWRTSNAPISWGSSRPTAASSRRRPSMPTWIRRTFPTR